LIHSSRFFLSDTEEVVGGDESGVGVCFGLIVFNFFCGSEGVWVGDVKWNVFRFLGVAATVASSANGDNVEWGCGSGLVSRGMGCEWHSLIVDVGSEDWVVVVDRHHDGFVVDVDGVKGFSWSPGSPVVGDVEVPTSDEGSEEVEMIVFGVHANENNPIVGAKGEDGRGGETCVGEFMVD
jgi:hypothetical protein